MECSIQKSFYAKPAAENNYPKPQIQIRLCHFHSPSRSLLSPAGSVAYTGYPARLLVMTLRLFWETRNSTCGIRQPARQTSFTSTVLSNSIVLSENRRLKSGSTRTTGHIHRNTSMPCYRPGFNPETASKKKGLIDPNNHFGGLDNCVDLRSFLQFQRFC